MTFNEVLTQVRELLEREGLEIISVLQRLSSPSPFKGEGRGEDNVMLQPLEAPHPSPLPQGAREFAGTLFSGTRGLQVRIGVHTGLVVVGDIGAPGRTEQLALGETPNLAARIQSLAEPNTAIVSAAMHRLIEEQFECQPFGSQRKPKPAFSKPSILRASSKRNPGNSAHQRAWLVCGNSRVRKLKLTSCCLRSTIGSPKVLTPKTCKRRKHCWKS